MSNLLGDAMDHEGAVSFEIPVPDAIRIWVGLRISLFTIPQSHRSRRLHTVRIMENFANVICLKYPELQPLFDEMLNQGGDK